jgi:ABC-2 type transport system ATP-binding protein
VTAAIRTSGLTRRFGALTAVDALTLDLPAAGVIGLVGPNGSGKSTLIRMLLGLIRPTSGTAEVMGTSIAEPVHYAARVGALIEGPAFVPGLSAHANLLSLARLRGLPATRVAEVLDTVGLAGRDAEPVANFSLGMKQRLGIAAALLPDPELLLLDEPTNGLDPAGIVEIRALLRALGAQGRTVVVSSHLLSEIEAACDHVVVIRFGRLLFTGPLADLLAQAEQHVDVAPEHTADLARLQALLSDTGWATVRGPDGLRVDAPPGEAPAINRAATVGGITLRTLAPRQETLEDVFLRLTGDTDGELAADRAAQLEVSGTSTTGPVRSRQEVA